MPRASARATAQFDIIFSDPHISSTCELVLWLSQAMWGCRHMDSDVARCLYTGLSTDTGGFAFSCDQPSCFEAAAVLVKYNIEPAEIHNRIINTFSLDRMKFYGFALSQRMRVYPGKRVVGVFQPHLYTRTRDFAPEFAQALSLADEVFLLPIYPARELPIEGVTSEIILKDVKSQKKSIYTKENFINSIPLLNFDILLTVGAGDIVNLLPQICQQVKKQSR